MNEQEKEIYLEKKRMYQRDVRIKTHSVQAHVQRNIVGAMEGKKNDNMMTLEH